MVTGARAYYDEIRARRKTRRRAARQLAKRWVGILHACPERRDAYDESLARKQRIDLSVD